MSIRGQAALTLNDIRELFGCFHIKRAEHTYTAEGGAKAKSSNVCEVLIFNWDLKAKPAGLF